MKMFPLVLTAAVIMALSVPSKHAAADTFGGGADTFEIEFIAIGDAGNPADRTGAPNPVGAVDYVYNIGKHEISRDMIEKANSEGGLGITLSDMTFTGGNGANQPATGVNWFEAATFVNWLNTSSGHPASYKFNGEDFEQWQPEDPGYDAANPFRNSLAHYFLPSVHEWYKAAYFDPRADVYFQFPTGSDTAPIAVASGTAAGTAVYDGQFGQPAISGPAEITQAGGLSPYGTMAQGGNVWEWEETEIVNAGSSWRGWRGGDWLFGDFTLSSSFRFSNPPGIEQDSTGFRVASIPEPSTFALAALGLTCLVARRRKKQAVN
jgi:formylglycine-generating enzyme required for sulfatase activity